MSDSRQSVQVVARFRPQNQLEKESGGDICVEFVDEKTVSVVDPSAGTEGTFTFDRTFGMASKQKEVFDLVALPVVQSIFDGYNATIFAYGQTSAGKTHTMMGPSSDEIQGYCDDPEEKGLIPRLCEAIFNRFEESGEEMEFTVRVSYFEIYMERVRDLLDPSRTNLSIHEEKGGRGVFVEGATETFVSSVVEMFGIMQLGAQNRVVSATRMNEGSSRSHSILSITLIQKNLSNFEKKSSKLFLVDLAGSEKVSKTGAEGLQLDEAKMINKSLSALGNVINALTDDRTTHIPYRDSKLTRLLQDSLGGNSRTTLVICCSPSTYNTMETTSTLRFGHRAKNIKNSPHVNREYTVPQLKKMFQQSQKRVESLQQYIEELEANLKLVHSGSRPMASVSADEENVEKEGNEEDHEEVLIDKIRDMQQQIKALTEEKTELDMANEILIERMTQQQGESEKTKDLLVEFKEDSKALEKENEILLEKVTDLTLQLRRTEHRLEFSKKELDAAVEAKKKAEENLTTLSSHLKLREEMGQDSEADTALRRVLQVMSDGMAMDESMRKNEELQMKSDEAIELAERVSQLEYEIQRLENKKETLTKHVTSLESSEQAFFMKKDGSVASVGSEDTVERRIYEEEHEKVLSHQRMNEAQREEIDRLEIELARAKAECSDLARQIEEAEPIARSLIPSGEDAEKNDGEDDVSELQGELERLLEMQKAHHEEIRMLRDEMDQKEVQYKGEIRKLAEKLDRSKEDSQWQIEKMSASHKNKISYFEDMLKKKDEIISLKEKEIKRLSTVEREVENLRIERKRLRSENRELEDLRRDFSRDLSASISEKLRLQMELDERKEREMILRSKLSDKSFKKKYLDTLDKLVDLQKAHEDRFREAQQAERDLETTVAERNRYLKRAEQLDVIRDGLSEELEKVKKENVKLREVARSKPDFRYVIPPNVKKTVRGGGKRGASSMSPEGTPPQSPKEPAAPLSGPVIRRMMMRSQSRVSSPSLLAWKKGSDPRGPMSPMSPSTPKTDIHEEGEMVIPGGGRARNMSVIRPPPSLDGKEAAPGKHDGAGDDDDADAYQSALI